MKNLKTSATATKTANPYIFIEFPDEQDYDQEGNFLRKIYVGKQDWFEMMAITETYNQYGQILRGEYEMLCAITDDCERCNKLKTAAENEGEWWECDGECEFCNEAIYQVKAYNYWDGSNHQSLIVESDYFDVDAQIIEDESEISRFTKAVNKIENGAEYLEPAGTGYQAAKFDGLRVVQSQWQGSWELYTIEISE